MKPKYSEVIGKCADKIIPSSLPESTRRLVAASLSNSSWNKNTSALKKFEHFEKHVGVTYTWPLSEEVIQKFVDFCLSKDKLKAATVNSYLSTLSFVHKINSWKNPCFNFVTKAMLTGAENFNFYTEISGSSRKVMTLPVLKILGHQIAKTDWSKDSKQVVWTAATVAFFGSFRMGEILSKDGKNFHFSENLLWRDVKVREDSVLIKIKIPKNRKSEGEFIDLFEYKDSSCCPVMAIKRLSLIKGREVKIDKPVFQFSSGVLLTQSVFNATLQTLLTPVIGPSASGFSGHSFRAAIPSALANCPDIACDEDIRKWGRWDSTSFRKYTRLTPQQKKRIFVKVVSALDVM